MTSRVTRSVSDRETSGAIDFDAALEAYLDGGDPLDEEHALAIAEMTRLRLRTGGL